MRNADEGEILLYIYANMQNIMDELTSRIYIFTERETYAQKKLKPRNWELSFSVQIEC